MYSVVTKICQRTAVVLYLGSRDFRGLGSFTRLSEDRLETGSMGRSELILPIISSGRGSIQIPGVNSACEVFLCASVTTCATVA
jgi:hypothetical protein